MRLNYLALPLAFVALSASAQEQAPAPRPQSMLGSLPGYLKPGETPDDRILLSPPPASGSAAEGRDKDAASAAIALRGAPRWDLATRDADLSSPTAAFTCALGVELTPDKAPRSATLLRRAMVDLAMSTNGSKA